MTPESARPHGPDVVPADVMPRFAVVDIETSGLSTRRHRILQIAVVTVVDGAVVDDWASLVRLDWPWQRVGPREIHGLDRRTLRSAPRRRAVLTELAARLDGAVFAAHNVGFDWAFVERAAAATRVELPVARRLCTLQLSRRLDPDRNLSHRLGDVCDRYGIVNDRPHDARFDALATAQVLSRLLQAHGISAPADLEPFYDRR